MFLLRESSTRFALFMSTSFNLWLQSFPALSPLMKVASNLGNEEFFLLLIPFVYLCINRKIGLRLGALILCCDALCAILKIAFALPRPYWIDARVLAISSESSFGFPSSHAMVSAAVWPFLARQTKRVWLMFAAIFLVILIGISRVFLGVHSALDVVVGIVLGIAFLAFFLQLEAPISRWFARQKLANQIAFSAIVALIILALFGAIRVLDSSPNMAYAKFFEGARSWDSVVGRGGAIFGLGCGAVLAQRFARFQIGTTILQKAFCLLVVLLGIAFFYIVLKRVFPSDSSFVAQTFRFERYVFIAVWITFGAPFLLLKMKWLRAEEENGTRISYAETHG